MSARSNILGRLRSAAAIATPLPDVASWYATHQRNEGISQRIARLRSALESVHTEVHVTTDTDCGVSRSDMLRGVAVLVLPVV